MRSTECYYDVYFHLCLATSTSEMYSTIKHGTYKNEKWINQTPKIRHVWKFVACYYECKYNRNWYLAFGHGCDTTDSPMSLYTVEVVVTFGSLWCLSHEFVVCAIEMFYVSMHGNTLLYLCTYCKYTNCRRLLADVMETFSHMHLPYVRCIMHKRFPVAPWVFSYFTCTEAR